MSDIQERQGEGDVFFTAGRQNGNPNPIFWGRIGKYAPQR
jgi:hypothetical protein